MTPALTIAWADGLVVLAVAAVFWGVFLAKWRSRR